MLESNLTKFSPSMLIDYLTCPMLFYYRYIAKIQIPQKQIHLLFGGAIHAAIEELYNENDPYVAFKKNFVKEKLMEDERDKFKEFFELGYEMIKNYSIQHPMLNSLYDLNHGKSEVYIKRKLVNPLTGEETSLPMTGRIDRLTNSGKIIEYKTSSREWKEEDMNYRIQTMLYNLWFLTEYGDLPEETVYIVLLKKYKKVDNTKTLQVLTHHSTITDLASIFDEVELLINKINNREFSRPSGFHPAWCDCYKYEEFLNLNQQ